MHLKATYACLPPLQDTEEYINIELDAGRNRLIRLDIVLTAASFAIAPFNLLAGGWVVHAGAGRQRLRPEGSLRLGSARSALTLLGPAASPACRHPWRKLGNPSLPHGVGQPLLGAQRLRAAHVRDTLRCCSAAAAAAAALMTNCGGEERQQRYAPAFSCGTATAARRLHLPPPPNPASCAGASVSSTPSFCTCAGASSSEHCGSTLRRSRVHRGSTHAVPACSPALPRPLPPAPRNDCGPVVSRCNCICT